MMMGGSLFALILDEFSTDMLSPESAISVSNALPLAEIVNT